MNDEYEMTSETEEEKSPRGIFRIMSLRSLIFFLIGISAGIIQIFFMIFPKFADFFNDNVSFWARFVLAKVTSIYPASLAEAVLLCMPVILFLVFRAMWKYMNSTSRGFIRSLAAVLSFAALMYSLFVIDFGAGYRTTTISEKMGLKTEKVSAEELYDVALTIVDRLNATVENVTFSDGASVMPTSYEENVAKITDAYDTVREEYPFIKNFKAPVKRLLVSPVMTYTHISGAYSFYTGEANLNTNYPDFVKVYSTAHEMAHQRGIARENEANFVAYLVLISSDDPYLQYCGYLNMFEYFTDALYGASKDLYKDAYTALDPKVKRELNEYSSFFDKYRGSTASKVTDKVNDTYLVLHGTEGTRSYGLVVDLAIAYHRSGK